MKVTKIIPKTIPLLILRHENPKILSKIGQNVPYLVVLGGYAYTLGGVYYILRRIVAVRRSFTLALSSLLWEVSLQENNYQLFSLAHI